MIAEYDRVGAQIVETDELITAHAQRAGALEGELGERERERVSTELIERLKMYVSAEADRIEALARAEVGVRATVERLEEYGRLFARLDEATKRIGELSQRQAEIEAALERAEYRAITTHNAHLRHSGGQTDGYAPAGEGIRAPSLRKPRARWLTSLTVEFMASATATLSDLFQLLRGLGRAVEDRVWRGGARRRHSPSHRFPMTRSVRTRSVLGSRGDRHD